MARTLLPQQGAREKGRSFYLSARLTSSRNPRRMGGFDGNPCLDEDRGRRPLAAVSPQSAARAAPAPASKRRGA